MEKIVRNETDLLCQIASIPHLGQPIPARELGPMALRVRLKLYLKRILSTKTKRVMKMKLDMVIQQLKKVTGNQVEPVPQEASVLPSKFKVGDKVRIRPKDEIVSTLNSWGELKGCSFMAGMEPYCGTVQRVWKPVERFVDERDYRVKKTRGIYILENLFCQGTGGYGHCDRSCFFFWREEWLTNVD